MSFERLPLVFIPGFRSLGKADIYGLHLHLPTTQFKPIFIRPHWGSETPGEKIDRVSYEIKEIAATYGPVSVESISAGVVLAAASVQRLQNINPDIVSGVVYAAGPINPRRDLIHRLGNRIGEIKKLYPTYMPFMHHYANEVFPGIDANHKSKALTFGGTEDGNVEPALTTLEGMEHILIETSPRAIAMGKEAQHAFNVIKSMRSVRAERFLLEKAFA